MQAVSGKGLGPGETGAPLRLMVLSLAVGTQVSKYRHTKPPAQELEVGFKDRTDCSDQCRAWPDNCPDQ